MGSAQPQPTRTYDFAGGSNAVADDVDTDLNTLYTVLQGGVGNTHIADDAAIAFSKLEAVAWTTYTPTWTAETANPAIGNGTLTGKYEKIGRKIEFKIRLIFGSTTTAGTGSWRFTLPVNAESTTFLPNLTILVEDYSASVTYGGNAALLSVGVIVPTCYYVSGTEVRRSSITGTYPFTWTTSDYILVSGTYESAS